MSSAKSAVLLIRNANAGMTIRMAKNKKPPTKKKLLDTLDLLYEFSNDACGGATDAEADVYDYYCILSEFINKTFEGKKINEQRN